MGKEIVKIGLLGSVLAPISLVAGAITGAAGRLGTMASALRETPRGQLNYSRDDLAAIERQSGILAGLYLVGAGATLAWAVATGAPAGIGAAGFAFFLAALGRRQLVRRKIARSLLPAVVAVLMLSLSLAAWSTPAAADDGLLPALAAAAEADPATAWLNAIVGANGETAFAALLGWINSVMLGIGSLILGYNVWAGTIQTAHEGQLLGRRWSSLWAPLRVPFAVVCLVPVNGGLSAWQDAVLVIAKYSIGAANLALRDVVDKVVDDAAPIIDPPNPDARKLVAGLIESYTCSMILHQQQIWMSAGASTSQPVVVHRRDEPGKITLSWDGQPGSGLGQEVCGSVIVAVAPTTNGLAASTRQKILAAHVKALDQASEGAAQIGKQIATHVLADPNSAIRSPLPSLDAFEGLVGQYQSTVLSDVRAVIKGDRSFRSTRETVAAEIKSAGWSGLGAMYARVAALNATVLEATTEVPEVRAPSKSLSPASSIGNSSVYIESSSWLPLAQWLKEARRDPDRLRKNATGDEGESSVLRFIDLGRAAAAFDSIQMTNQGGTRSSVMQTAANIGHLIIPAGWTALAGGFLHSTVGTIGLGLLLLGGWLAYWLPMIPYLTWLGAVMAWLLLVVEALAAGSLWCLSHLRMDGEGISGGANTGWLVTLNMSLRPLMLVAGFLASIQLFELGGTFVSRTFVPAVSSMLGSHFGGISAFVAVIILWIACLHLIANFAFGAITILPDRIMRWLESHQSGVGEQQHVDKASHSAVAVVAGGNAGALPGVLHAMGRKKGNDDNGDGGGQMNADKFFGGIKPSQEQAEPNNNNNGQHNPNNGKFFR